jgi:hypothetical protein
MREPGEEVRQHGEVTAIDSVLSTIFTKKGSMWRDADAYEYKVRSCKNIYSHFYCRSKTSTSIDKFDPRLSKNSAMKTYED